MRKSRHFKISSKVLIALLAASIILLVPLIVAYINSPDNSAINSIQDVENQCKPASSSISTASSCAVKVTSSFYKYNIDNIGKDLSFSDLKSQGGVCSSWSHYYSDVGKDLGFQTKNVIIPTAADSYHEFSVWSDSKGYCVIDETESTCFNFSID